MFISHFSSFLLKSFLALTVVFSLISCSGGGGDGGSSSTSPNPATANILNLSWAAPAEREDGSGLNLTEISAYQVYYGTEAGNYPNKIKVDSCACSSEGTQIANISPGKYHVVVTTIDTDGRESVFSAEVVVTV